MATPEEIAAAKVLEDAAAETAAAAATVLKDLQDKLSATEADNERLTAKISESNKHTKAAEKAAAKVVDDKAKKEGNFEQLYKSSETSRLELEEINEGLIKDKEFGKVKDRATKMSIILNPVDGGMPDCIRKVGLRLKFDSGSVKVLDKHGNLTERTFDQLTEELKGSADFSYMLKGSQSSGGGAGGGSNDGGGATGEKIKRTDFDALTPQQRKAKIKAGAVIT